MVDLTVDGTPVSVADGATILDACRSLGHDIPTLCYLETLHPVNACRVCVVELEGSRVLVPSCSRVATPGMVVQTDTERVRHSRKMVLEFLASSVDLSTAPSVDGWLQEYGCRPERYGPSARVAGEGERDALVAGHHAISDPGTKAAVTAMVTPKRARAAKVPRAPNPVDRGGRSRNPISACARSPRRIPVPTSAASGISNTIEA